MTTTLTLPAMNGLRSKGVELAHSLAPLPSGANVVVDASVSKATGQGFLDALLSTLVEELHASSVTFLNADEGMKQRVVSSASVRGYLSKVSFTKRLTDGDSTD